MPCNNLGTALGTVCTAATQGPCRPAALPLAGLSPAWALLGCRAASARTARYPSTYLKCVEVCERVVGMDPQHRALSARQVHHAHHCQRPLHAGQGGSSSTRKRMPQVHA